MTTMPFHVLFPEEVKNECRPVTPTNHESLPNRTFLFMAGPNDLCPCDSAKKIKKCWRN